MFGECHGHIFMNGRNYKEAADLHRSGVNRKDVEETLAAYRAAGITFFREGGDPFGVCAYAAEIAGDYGIDYRSPAFAIHKKGHYGGIVGLEYETLPEFAALVKRAAAQGADFIKIMFSGILDFNVYGKITGTGLPEEETKELVHICHEEGFSVMVHVNGRENVHHAIESGVDSVEHGAYITDEELSMMAETGTVWTPTISPVANLRGLGRFDEESLERITAMQMEHIRKAFALGVSVALGSDAGAVTVPHVKGLMDEYQYLLAAADGRKEWLEQELRETEALVKERFRRK